MAFHAEALANSGIPFTDALFRACVLRQALLLGSSVWAAPNLEGPPSAKNEKPAVLSVKSFARFRAQKQSSYPESRSHQLQYILKRLSVSVHHLQRQFDHNAGDSANQQDANKCSVSSERWPSDARTKEHPESPFPPIS